MINDVNEKINTSTEPKVKSDAKEKLSKLIDELEK